MTDSYGIWWFKMPIVYHPKTFVTNPKWFWGMIKSGLKMFWLDVRGRGSHYHVDHGHRFCASATTDVIVRNEGIKPDFFSSEKRKWK